MHWVELRIDILRNGLKISKFDLFGLGDKKILTRPTRTMYTFSVNARLFIIFD